MSARRGPSVRPAGPVDRAWIESFLDTNGMMRAARRGELVRPLDYPMLMAFDGDEPAGLLSYVPGADECEVLTLHSVKPRRGAGSARGASR